MKGNETTMNIAFLAIASLHNPKESAYLTTLGLVKSLIQKGHRVVIITEKKAGLPQHEIMAGVPVYRLYRFPFLGRVFSYPFALRKIQRKLKIRFDIIHGFSATPLFAGSIILSKLFSPNAKTVHTLKSYSRNEKANRGYFLLHGVDRVTIPTKVYGEKLGNIKKNKISLIHSPIDTIKFFPQDKKDLKKKYGYEKNKILFYYGAMWKNKGVDILIDAMPTLIQFYPDLKLVCAPRYENIQEHRDLVKKLGLNHVVEFITGNIPIEEYVNFADVVVLPYRNLQGTEGNPSCLLEAMSCKTLVVTTDLPELREIANGLVFMAKPGDVDSLTETIIQAMGKKDQEMIEKAYHKVQEFSFERITEEFLKLYEKLVGNSYIV